MKCKAYIILLICVIAMSCNQNDLHVHVVTPTVLEYTAQCQRDTIVLSSKSEWRAESLSDWITIECESGSCDGNVPLYIQQNDGISDRIGEIKLYVLGLEDITIEVRQEYSDLNSNAVLVNLPMTYGVGWGYDYSLDHADLSGIRGQILDEAKLKKILGDTPIIYEPYSHTYSECISEESSTELINSITTSLEGEVDVKLASVKVSGEFSKQTQENKDRMYFWYRESRAVKMAFLVDDDITQECLTTDFINAVDELKKRGDVKDFVMKYGTHFIWSSTLGGKFDWYFTISQDVKASAEKVVTTISTKLLFWNHTSTSVDEKIWSEISKDFVASFRVTGGGKKGTALNSALQETACKGERLNNPELITNWQNCFTNFKTAKDDELTMIDFNVSPIWNIVRLIDVDSATKVKEYIVNNYLI